jgi:hypothetical protein
MSRVLFFFFFFKKKKKKKNGKEGAYFFHKNKGRGIYSEYVIELLPQQYLK